MQGVAAAESMPMTPPSSRAGILEIGILGQQATASVRQTLESQGAQVGLDQGPKIADKPELLLT
jgi:hypothetical protein